MTGLRRLRILVVLPDLSGGGAQRTVLNLVNHLDRRRFEPVLALYRRQGPLLESLRSDVRVAELGCRRPRVSIVPVARCIRRLRPDLVFSTLIYTNTATVLGHTLARTPAPVVIRETNNHTVAALRIPPGVAWLVRWSYRRANTVVTLSDGVRADVIRRYDLPAVQVVTIYNPVDVAGVRRRCQEPAPPIPGWSDRPDRPRLIAVGRLERQKGFDILLDAVARLRVPASLAIVGQGAEEQALREQARRLGVEDRVVLAGFRENPFPYVAAADLFVLSSRWEGFGHVVVEAMACGSPVLATRCPSGPDEIITDGVDGRLCEVGSPDALARHIDELLADADMRKRYAERARESLGTFDVSAIVRRYEALFERAVETCA